MFDSCSCTFLVFYLSSLICVIRGQLNVPVVACPNYFEYLISNEGTYIGKITLPNIRFGTNTVNVELTQRSLVDEYFGALSLFEDKDTTLQKLQNAEPISYRLDFPQSNELPKLTKIAVNGRVICLADQYPTPSTTIKLEHSFRTTITTTTTTGSKQDDTNTATYYGENTPNAISSYTPTSVISQTPTRVPIYPTKATTAAATNQFDAAPQATETKEQQQQQQQQQQPIEQRIGQNVEAVCGKEGAKSTNSFTPFVVGGKALSRGEYPWLSGIYRKSIISSTFICGGSLISANFVLSGAICFDTIDPQQYSVTLGRYNLTDSMEKFVSRHLKDIIIHKDYKPDSNNYADANLALLRMIEPVSFTNFVSPICLWPETAAESAVMGQLAVVTGWGYDANNMISAVPKKVQAQIVSYRQCLQSSLAFQPLTSERTLCAGQRDGTGPCTGDSGNGLMVLLNNRWVIRGIVSTQLLNKNGCDLQEYVVYADVAKHISWIKENIKK